MQRLLSEDWEDMMNMIHNFNPCGNKISKPFIEVINVGQGDSIIIRFPPSTYICDNDTYIIDLGSGSVNVSDYVKNEKVSIVMTHHHSDHVGGFKYFAGKMDHVKSVILPYCQNEITLIAKALLNLKGLAEATDCAEFINDLNGIVNDQLYMNSVSKEYGSHILRYIHEGSHIGNNIDCLNPPNNLERFDWLNELNNADLKELLDQLFTPEYSETIRAYMTEIRMIDRSEERSARSFDRSMSEKFDFWLSEFGENEEYPNLWHELILSRANFVYGFILRNIPLIQDFNRTSSRKSMRKLYTRFVKSTHDACIVLKASCAGSSFLLTGDASAKVFNRLLNEGKDISADYLKMPHHGSKNNISSSILDAIAPKVAIISHKNGRFNRSKDTHPNTETLDLLRKRHVKILITNDVIKNGVVVMHKGRHCKDSMVQID